MADITANWIQYHLANWVKGNSDVVVPNFFFGYNECDVFQITQAGLIVEFEIKISRSDFFADTKKGTASQGPKHQRIANGIGPYCPNRFVFVVPEGLITPAECPKHTGLLYFDGGPFLQWQKKAPLLHKNKADIYIYREVARTLASKSMEQRKKIRRIRQTDMEALVSEKEREIENLKKEKRDASNVSYTHISASRRMNRVLQEIKKGNVDTTEIEGALSFYERVVNKVD